MGTPFKMKGSPMQRNFEISPLKNDKLYTRGVDKDGNKVSRGRNVNKDKVVSTGKYQQKGSGNEGGLVKVLDYRTQDNKKKPGNFKGVSFDAWSKSK